MRVRHPALVVLAALALLALPGCGDDAGKPSSGSPYAAKDPSGTQAGGYAAGAGGAGAAKPGLSADLGKKVATALKEGRDLLLSVQDESGAWGDPSIEVPPNGGYTAMAVASVIGATPRSDVAGDAAIRKALDYLASLQKENGAIFDNPGFANYITSAAVGAFALAKIPAYAPTQAKGKDFLVQSQIAGDESDPSYGGFPYKQDQGQPADLSNVQFALTALADAGLEKDSPVWERARAYLGRMQNRSESNAYVTTIDLEGTPTKVVAGDDGGAYYHPGNSKAGYVERADGTVEPRSYGSMTYALLKCFLLSGIDPNDPRVLAALAWTMENFTVERNPGFESAVDAEQAGQQGWYYYVFTLARTLAQYEAMTKEPLPIKDAQGKEHNWRAELAAAILARRGADGWWVNDQAERWEEGSRVLASSYALQALAELSGRFR